MSSYNKSSNLIIGIYSSVGLWRPPSCKQPPTLDKSDHRHDLNIVGVGWNADTQSSVMCCREVDMNPPMQTAAAIAEVDVRASA